MFCHSFTRWMFIDPYMYRDRSGLCYQEDFSSRETYNKVVHKSLQAVINTIKETEWERGGERLLSRRKRMQRPWGREEVLSTAGVAAGEGSNPWEAGHEGPGIGGYEGRQMTT